MLIHDDHQTLSHGGRQLVCKMSANVTRHGTTSATNTTNN